MNGPCTAKEAKHTFAKTKTPQTKTTTQPHPPRHSRHSGDSRNPRAGQGDRVSPARGGNVRRTKGATDRRRSLTGPAPFVAKGARPKGAGYAGDEGQDGLPQPPSSLKPSNPLAIPNNQHPSFQSLKIMAIMVPPLPLGETIAKPSRRTSTRRLRVRFSWFAEVCRRFRRRKPSGRGVFRMSAPGEGAWNRRRPTPAPA